MGNQHCTCVCVCTFALGFVCLCFGCSLVLEVYHQLLYVLHQLLHLVVGLGSLSLCLLLGSLFVAHSLCKVLHLAARRVHSICSVGGHGKLAL